ncbi:MAG: FAD-binding protein [Methanosphaera sp.]|nr:FAD-binding protein [Methanosphaera sp.]
MKNVIIIGAGLAGLTCSLKLAEKGIKVKLFSPSNSEQSQSVMAMGGINAALNTKGQDDSTQKHYKDTINGGQKINNPDAVMKLTEDAPKIIEWLSDIGTSFTRDENGNVDLRYFGGQKNMRTAYAGAKTGKQIVTSINMKCRKYESENMIKRFVGWRFLSLITTEDTGECAGVVLLNEDTNKIEEFFADYVVIATGGMNKLFGKISGSLQNDGCATARLLKQNVKLANLEMIQYHPTTINTPVKRMLITEAARGEGGRLYTLVDGKKWYFMEEWYPELGALMPRDVVSRSIYKVCNQMNLRINGENFVYLDITHLPEESIKVKLDEVYDVCTQYLNINPIHEPIPVYPGVHYFMGGILTDDEHKTNIKNLFAVGECSCQYHGANRLGGNSLLGAIHGGWIAAEEIAKDKKKSEKVVNHNVLEKELKYYDKWLEIQKKDNLISSYAIEEKLFEIMNNVMGIYRNEKELDEGIRLLKEIEENIDNINSHECYYDYIQLNSLITLAKAMILSANERRESRGSHQRIDYPETNDEKYLKNTTVILEKNNIKISFEETNNKMGW